jgi:indolepyruvate ferredoxin oxidoreductase, alpha subunit
MTDLVLLGSTEILEYLIRYRTTHGGPHAAWCANEKSTYEAALGVPFAGRRTMTSMEHVNLKAFRAGREAAA